MLKTSIGPRGKVQDYALGPRNRRVAILGAFDTWSLMHYVASQVSQRGYVAITSMYIYAKANTREGYYRSQYLPDKNESMTHFLKHGVIGLAGKAIILYSVPAAHYNEAEWCSKKDPPFRTLGLVFVRSIVESGGCIDCIPTSLEEYSQCQGTTSAWDCISKPKCPFKTQGVAKNQLEYYTLSKSKNMKLIAVERPEKIGSTLSRFLRGKWLPSQNRMYLYEFRIKLSEKRKRRLLERINFLTNKEEEGRTKRYEYEDFYYKPVGQSINRWLLRNQPVRIRHWTRPGAGRSHVITSKIRRMRKGLIALHMKGSIRLYEGKKPEANSLLKGMRLECFAIVSKVDGVTYIVKEPFEYVLNIEKVKARFTEKENPKTLGWFLEVEVWISSLMSSKKLSTMSTKIIKYLGLPKTTSIETRTMQQIAVDNLTP